jgi:uncharacterized UBP type Zn finger protein
MLEGMGFPPVRCHRALLATGNSDGEAAMEWLFTHMEDPGPFYSLFSLLFRSDQPLISESCFLYC